MLKIVLFKMWERVESGQFEARSFVGDLALDIRNNVYGSNTDAFWSDYESWKDKHNKRRTKVEEENG
jgi:hypothetical protein